MKQMLLHILKTLSADARKTIFGVILLAILGGTGGVLYLSRTALNYGIETANILTPLWATIASALLCCVYIYINTQKILNKINESNQVLCSPVAKTDNGKEVPLKFIYHKNLLWLSDDLAPFCPACYEVNGKIIHVKLLHESNNMEEWNYYECHNCAYRADFSDHPNSVPF
ncbi:MAG: hypothetical protein V1782_11805 [Pseudomonadota bacterium]